MKTDRELIKNHPGFLAFRASGATSVNKPNETSAKKVEGEVTQDKTKNIGGEGVKG